MTRPLLAPRSTAAKTCSIDSGAPAGLLATHTILCDPRQVVGGQEGPHRVGVEPLLLAQLGQERADRLKTHWDALNEQQREEIRDYAAAKFGMRGLLGRMKIFTEAQSLELMAEKLGLEPPIPEPDYDAIEREAAEVARAAIAKARAAAEAARAEAQAEAEAEAEAGASSSETRDG